MYKCKVCGNINDDVESVCTECMTPKKAICQTCGCDMYKGIVCGDCLDAREITAYNVIKALMREDLNNLEIANSISIDDSPVRSISDEKSQKQTGLKYDKGKLRLDLIPVETYESLGRVLTYGAEKYSPNSWQQVESDRYVAALLRHFVAYMKDPTGVDEESGLQHIEHLLCNAMFLNYMVKKKLNNEEEVR